MMSKKHPDESRKDADELGREIEADQIEEVEEAIEAHNADVSRQQLDALTTERDEARDDLLRCRAELENVRRRAENDVANAHKYAVEKFAAEVLLVRDSLDVANQIELDADNQQVVEKMREGMALTLRQLDNAMQKFGIEEIVPQPGDKLDPERHQAMSLVEAEGVAANHVVSVIQKGYSIRERLLRPAMVMVAK